MFSFHAVNSCSDTTRAVYSYTVTYDDCDSACIYVEIERTTCVNLGTIVDVEIYFNGQLRVGGYDLLIKYDVSALNFVSASRGVANSGWEYFTYRAGPFGNCGSACPPGLVRLVAIADANNGAAHPPLEQFLPNGSISSLRFQVTADNTFEGLVYPVDFFWFDCGDNAFSSVTGDTLLIDRIIYNASGAILWDETDNVNYPESARFPFIGAPDECLAGGKFQPVRCVDLRNGYICIIDNDSIDARGDLNLNGIANEIADAVLFTNYFLRGLSVFHISVHAQIAASDINADGIPLTVGDLIYLLRIIAGDALPIPKLAPYGAAVEFKLTSEGSATTLWSNSAAELGGVYLKVTPAQDVLVSVSKAAAAAGLELEYAQEDGVLNVLLYSKAIGASIEAGVHPILTFDASVQVEHIEASDYYGNMLSSKLSLSVLPDNWSLEQNYPNPFNPETVIPFALPRAADWTLTVYNVNGQVVKRFTGSDQPGIVTVNWDSSDQHGASVASGVYFYSSKPLVSAPRARWC